MKYVMLIIVGAVAGLGGLLDDVALVAFWIVGCCVLGSYDLAKRKGRSGILHAAITLILWVPWVIVVALLKPLKRCPYCQSSVHAKAAVCRYCHRELSQPVEAAADGGKGNA